MSGGAGDLGGGDCVNPGCAGSLSARQDRIGTDPPDIGEVLAESGTNDNAQIVNSILNTPQVDIVQGPYGFSFNALAGPVPPLGEGDVSVVVHGGGPLMPNGDVALAPSQDF